MKAAGHIEFRHDPVSYGGAGRNPDYPYKVQIDVDPANPHLGARHLTSAQTYDIACRKLAAELAWRDPEVRRLRAKALAAEEDVREREYQRLIALPEPT